MTYSLKNIDVVLVRCQIPENAGFAARSLKAFGFGCLILVNPEFDFHPGSPAYKTASGATDVLDCVKIYATLNEAVAKHHRVIGFSRRPYQYARPRMDLSSWVESTPEYGQEDKIALIFGPEDFGLSNEERKLCQALIHIPVSVETLSLNLAHAITVVLYELTRNFNTHSEFPSKIVQTEDTSTEHRINHEDSQRILDLIVTLLDLTTFFKEGRREQQTEIIRSLLFRLDLTKAEYHTAMGFIRALFDLNQKATQTNAEEEDLSFL